MALTCYPVPGKLKSDLICKAFAHGAPRGASGSVFFGTEGQMSAFQRAKSDGTWWYVDNSYFDKHRGQYFRVTKNALQVDTASKASNGKRFAKLDIDIKPWRSLRLGADVLVVPQSDNFMKSTLGRTDNWGADMVKTLQAWGVEHVRMRPWQSDKIKLGKALLDDLPNLRLLITWSSASAITALLEGVPAISESGAARTLTGPLTVDSVRDPPRPSIEDRLQFAEVLADNQFTLEEFRDGTAWRHLTKS